MGEWHRDNPELVGTDADPWMAHPAHAAAAREVQMYQRFPNLDAMIAAEEAKTHRCVECEKEPAPRCACGGQLRPYEYEP